MDKIPGPWHTAYPIVGNLLECLRPDFHKVIKHQQSPTTCHLHMPHRATGP